MKVRASSRRHRRRISPGRRARPSSSLTQNSPCVSRRRTCLRRTSGGTCPRTRPKPVRSHRTGARSGVGEDGGTDAVRIAGAGGNSAMGAVDGIRDAVDAHVEYSLDQQVFRGIVIVEAAGLQAGFLRDVAHCRSGIALDAEDACGRDQHPFARHVGFRDLFRIASSPLANGPIVHCHGDLLFPRR